MLEEMRRGLAKYYDEKGLYGEKTQHGLQTAPTSSPMVFFRKPVMSQLQDASLYSGKFAVSKPAEAALGKITQMNTPLVCSVKGIASNGIVGKTTAASGATGALKGMSTALAPVASKLVPLLPVIFTAQKAMLDTAKTLTFQEHPFYEPTVGDYTALNHYLEKGKTGSQRALNEIHRIIKDQPNPNFVFNLVKDVDNAIEASRFKEFQEKNFNYGLLGFKRDVQSTLNQRRVPKIKKESLQDKAQQLYGVQQSERFKVVDSRSFRDLNNDDWLEKAQQSPESVLEYGSRAINKLG
jgi:hypothetical protein